MSSITHLVGVLLLLLWSAEKATAADSSSILGDVVSAVRKFTGGLTPVVELDYGKFQGVGDNITGTYNYLGRYKTVPSPPYIVIIVYHVTDY